MANTMITIIANTQALDDVAFFDLLAAIDENIIAIAGESNVRIIDDERRDTPLTIIVSEKFAPAIISALNKANIAHTAKGE